MQFKNFLLMVLFWILVILSNRCVFVFISSSFSSFLLECQFSRHPFHNFQFKLKERNILYRFGIWWSTCILRYWDLKNIDYSSDGWGIVENKLSGFNFCFSFLLSC